MGSHEPTASCYMGGLDPPLEGALLVDTAPIVNRHVLPLAVQKRADRFAVWVVDSSGRKNAQIQSY